MKTLITCAHSFADNHIALGLLAESGHPLGIVDRPSRQNYGDIIDVGLPQRTIVAERVSLSGLKIGKKGRPRMSGKLRPGNTRHCYGDCLRRQQERALLRPLKVDLPPKARPEMKAFVGEIT